MMVAAGYQPYNPPWDERHVIEALQRMAHTLGRAPLKEECYASPDGYPSASTIKRRFGSFTPASALRASNRLGAAAIALHEWPERWGDAQATRLHCMP